MRPTRFRRDALPLVAADRATLHRGEVRIEGGTFGAWTVDFIQTRGDQVVPMLIKKRPHGLGIKLAPGDAQSRGKLLRRFEHRVGNRNGSFHGASITPVIPSPTLVLAGSNIRVERCEQASAATLAGVRFRTRG